MKKKVYIKPDIEKITIDNNISLQMESPPKGGDDDGFKPRSSGNKSPGTEPFSSPFSDKPFD